MSAANSYTDLIKQFLFEEVPGSMKPTKGMIFEAVSSEILGTKQRRFGPMPSPEVQVMVRNAIVNCEDVPIQFFMPWGASKQDDGAPIDILEFFALKQLLCLKEALAKHNVQSNFTFRLEDLTDRYLLDPFSDNPRSPRSNQISNYVNNFQSLQRTMLKQPLTHARTESTDVLSYNNFRDRAESFFPTFANYLRGALKVSALQRIGWQGDIPQEQRDYYYEAYRKLGVVGDTEFATT